MSAQFTLRKEAFQILLYYKFEGIKGGEVPQELCENRRLHDVGRSINSRLELRKTRGRNGQHEGRLTVTQDKCSS